jgi:hypothetical protein
MLGVMTLPGVRVNGYQHLGVRWANLAWLLVFVGVVWWGSRRQEDPPEAVPEPAVASAHA